MKTTPSLLGSLSAALLITVLPVAVRAQTSTTTTTTTVDPNAPDATVTKQTTVTTTTEPTPVGQHVADIELTVARGRVQAYFGRAARAETIGIGDAKLKLDLPSRATVTKLASRDDDSPGAQHVTEDHPWHVQVPFDGAGRYVFNISDYDNDPVITSCVVKVDGQVLFSGHGSADDFNGWAEKFYGDGVRKSGSREVAFIVGGDR